MRVARWAREAYRIAREAALALFVRRLRLEFVLALARDYRMRTDALRLSLYVTSICSLDCEECIMQYLMKRDPKYHMSLEEIDRLVSSSERSRYKFDFILTGGEPLLWKNLKEGLRRLRASSICKSIQIFTNAMNISRLDAETVGYVDVVRVSEYSTNKENIQKLLAAFPDKVKVVNREEFWPNLREPMKGALPAVCLNPEMLLYDNKVYACPHSQSLAILAKRELRLSNPLAPGFVKGLFWIKLRQQRAVCTRCISNNRVRERVARIPNDVGRGDREPFKSAATG